MTTTPVVVPPSPAFIPKQSIDRQKGDPFVAWKQKGTELTSKYNETDAALETSQWLIGDWLLDGERFGKQKAYAEAAEITGWTIDHLYTVVWVVKRFRDISLRKETKLKWSHFKELARVKNQNTRQELLEQLSDGLDHSVLEVRNLVDRTLRNTSSPTKVQPNDRAYLRVSFKPRNCVRLKLLAKARHTTPDELLGKIVADYLKTNESRISAEINKAKESRQVLRRARAKH